MDKTPLRVSIIETAARSNYLYGPLSTTTPMVKLV
jgi:hypothetical protein